MSRYMRPPSPTRRSGQYGRSSAGSLDYPDAESYYHPRSSRDGFAPGPRSSADRVIGPRSAPRDPLPLRSRGNPDDYYVAPRRALERQPPPPSIRQPLSVMPPGNSSRFAPVISSAVEKHSSPYARPRGRDDDPYEVLPASSSRHNRHSSFGQSDPRYPDARPRERRDMYAREGPAYHGHAPPIREPRDKDDKDFGYEYTNHKEQAYRDTAPVPRPRMRRGSDSFLGRERPQSMTGIEDLTPRQPVYRREAGPPVSTRGFSKINQEGAKTTQYRIPRDSGRDGSPPRGPRDERDDRSKRRSLAPVSLHQDGYESANEGHRRERRHHGHERHGSLDRSNGLGIRYDKDARADERSHRRREEPRHDSPDRSLRPHRHHREDSLDRDAYPDTGRRRRHEDDDRERRTRDKDPRDKHGEHHHHHLDPSSAIGAAGAAVTGSAAEGERRRRRDKDKGDGDADLPSPRKPHRDAGPDGSETGGRGEETDEQRRERRRLRRHLRDEEERRRSDPSIAVRKDDVNAEYDRRPRERRDPDPRRPEGERRRRAPRGERAEDESDTTEDDERGARGDYRPSNLRVVSPAAEPERRAEPAAKPKGILRPPREKFPEDPAPIREGVAPLKDAGKKGIPPSARWTKIDRRLVNPEALELGNERFEERVEYVIVLRVLAKEEIEKYAEITAKIRGACPTIPLTSATEYLTFLQTIAPKRPSATSSSRSTTRRTTATTTTRHGRSTTGRTTRTTTRAAPRWTARRTPRTRPTPPTRRPAAPPPPRACRTGPTTPARPRSSPRPRATAPGPTWCPAPASTAAPRPWCCSSRRSSSPRRRPRTCRRRRAVCRPSSSRRRHRRRRSSSSSSSRTSRSSRPRRARTRRRTPAPPIPATPRTTRPRRTR